MPSRWAEGGAPGNAVGKNVPGPWRKRTSDFIDRAHAAKEPHNGSFPQRRRMHSAYVPRKTTPLRTHMRAYVLVVLILGSSHGTGSPSGDGGWGGRVATLDGSTTHTHTDLHSHTHTLLGLRGGVSPARSHTHTHMPCVAPSNATVCPEEWKRELLASALHNTHTHTHNNSQQLTRSVEKLLEYHLARGVGGEGAEKPAPTTQELMTCQRCFSFLMRPVCVCVHVCVCECVCACVCV